MIWMPYLKKSTKQKTKSFNKEDRQKVYQSAKWKKLRSAKLQADPLCEVCLEEDKITPAEDVHHIDSFMNYTGANRLFKAYDYNNLKSVCKDCHGKIHASDHPHY